MRRKIEHFFLSKTSSASRSRAPRRRALGNSFRFARNFCYTIAMASTSLWPRFQQYFLYYQDLDISLDISRIRFSDGFFEKMQSRIDHAFSSMRELESSAIANPDENRMVGHYWLRDSRLAPPPQLRADIDETNNRIRQFASDGHE